MTLWSAKVVAPTSNDVESSDTGSSYSEQGAGTSFVIALTGTTAAGRRNMGLRWVNVTIPPGSTIDDATLRLNIESTFRDDISVEVYGVKEANPATFNGTDRRPFAGDLTHTTAFVQWGPDTSVGTGYEDSPDIKTVIQELIDQGGWASGNAIALLVKGRNTSEGFDVSTRDVSATADTAELVINYTEPTGMPYGIRSFIERLRRQ